MLRRILPLAVALMMAATLAPTALAQPPEGTPQPPDDTPEPPERPAPPEEPGDDPGPPDEFPGPGEFPADPGERFPDEACGHTPARPSRVPTWVPLPFDGCAQEDEAQASG